jgi:rubrerythrin
MDRKGLFNLAITQEIRSQRLYEAMARSFGQPETHALFTELVLLEKNHEEKLRLLFAREFPDETPNPEPGKDRDLADIDVTDPSQLLLFAIGREEMASRLYLSFADVTDDPDIKTLMMQFADEEEKHRSLLLTEMQRILGALEWFDPSELAGYMDF